MKTTKKKQGTMWVQIAGYAAIGMVLGFLSVFMKEGGWQSLDDAPAVLTYAFPMLFVLVECGITIAAFITYTMTKKQYMALSPDDEEDLAVIEQKINVPICLYNIGVVLDACMFSITIFLSEHKGIEDTLWESILIVGSAALLILNIALLVWVGSMSVELVKQMNPEKRGDFMELDFQKKWEASLDEAEKMIQYQGAHKAYKAGQMACFALWGVNMLLQGGILTTIFIAVIWLTMVIVYQNEVVRLERGK